MIFDEFNRPEVIRRERRLKWFLIGSVVALLLGGFLYWQFKNFREERAVRNFLAAVQRGDYRGAYELWKPLPSYSYEDFLRDWGPQGDHGKIERFRLGRSNAQGSGVFVRVEINGKEKMLWVSRADRSISFAPF